MSADDPQADPLYRAEDSLGDVGPRLARWADVETFVERVVSDRAWVERGPWIPLEVRVVRRSRSARYAAATIGTDAIHIPDGQWRPLVVLHELAHLAAPGEEPHGPRFAGIELALVRSVLGFEVYGALRRAFDEAEVRYDPKLAVS